ncbi:MAG TPA: zf-HC2 domain-containing protein [Vicinamibacterales bacterium]|jgi:anti-sigma factor RsiW
MHEEWTDQLSDFLDGELTADAHAKVEAHVKECASCNAVLNDLKGIVARAQALDARPPAMDLWPGVAARIEKIAQPRRVSLTLPQLAAAAVVLMAISGAVAVKLLAPVDARPSAVAAVAPSQRPSTADATPSGPQANDVTTATVSYADAQYDAAVADLEKALKAGRGRLDQSTIDVVEHNLQIIDQAIAQARDALAADPANAYLSGHLVEARRRKLDLLRRAAALADTD